MGRDRREQTSASQADADRRASQHLIRHLTAFRLSNQLLPQRPATVQCGKRNWQKMA